MHLTEPSASVQLNQYKKLHTILHPRVQALKDRFLKKIAYGWPRIYNYFLSKFHHNRFRREIVTDT